MDQRLSDSWTECTKFTLLNDKHPKGFLWSGTRLTKIRATTGPDYLRPENVSGMSQAAQKREKQERAVEKPELDNVRKLRGIHFIQKLESTEKPFKNALKKLEIPMEAALPCKLKMRKRSQQVAGEPKDPTKSKRQTMHASWKLMNPRESVWNQRYQKDTRITSRRKGSIR